MSDGLEGWTEVGRPLPGPGAVLHPVVRGDGVPHLALTFRTDLVAHPMLHKGMEEIEGFVRTPGVAGLLPLVDWDEAHARFVYPVSGVLLSQLLDAAVEPAGVRAALELVAEVAPILDAASEAGARAGVYSHGALSPWRLLVARTGAARVFGYGVPPVDVLAWLDEETDDLDPRALVYTPPERIEDEDEDVRSDLFALALVGVLLSTGRLPLQGDPEDVVDRILAGAVPELVRDALVGAGTPRDAADLLASCTALKPADRPRSGAELARRAKALAANADGPSLAQVVGRHLGEPARGGDDLLEDTSFEFSVPDYTLPIKGVPEQAGETTQPLDGLLEQHDRPIGDPIDTDSTEVVSLSAAEQRTLASAARKAAGNPALPPTPRPRGPTPPPEPAEAPPPSRPSDTDEEDPLAPPVPDLGPSPSLEEVQAHARAIVDRAARLAKQAAAFTEQVDERAREADGDFAVQVDAARQAADRASKASASASSAANLLELDEDPAGALITLDLVRNAETQCSNAAREAHGLLRELARVVERARYQQQALRDAVQRALEHADAATDCADRADALVTALERDAREGLLAAPEVDDAIDEAITAAETAHGAAEEARRLAGDAREARRAEDAVRVADAVQAAERIARVGLESTEEAAQRARRVEADTRTSAIDTAEAHQSAALSSAETAEHALQRAEEALAIASPPESTELLPALRKAAEAARTAAQEAKRAATTARESPHSGDAIRQARATEQAATRAEEAEARAREASDRIVGLAGAVAEARAAVSKRHDEARQALEQARRTTERARSDVDTLFEETRRVSSEAALSARSAALTAVREAEGQVEKLDMAVHGTLELDDVDALDERLGAVRALATQIADAAAQAHDAIVDARSEAERELEELQRREALQAAVSEAAEEASDFAERCREQVDSAWTVARSLSEALKTTQVEEAIQLRSKALELIDIAEFQAGEAATSARLAGEEEEPAEARAHAQTARSFLERITTDLPEALEALREAEEIAQREQRTLEAARDRAAEIARTVERIARDVGVGLERARSESREWQDVPAVTTELGQLARLARSFDEDINESTWCRDQAAEVDLATEAAELLPRAEGALERARDKQRTAQSIAESLAKAIASAVAERQAMANARKAAADAATAAGDLLSRVQEAEERLKEAVQQHSAQDVPVANAQLRMREARQKVELTHKKLVLLAEQAGEGQDAQTTRRLAAQARELLDTAEQARDVATDAETEGIAAAEHEARARREAERRRLVTAREDADAQVERARSIIGKVDAALDESEEEAASSSTDARARFDQAVTIGEELRTEVARLEGLARSVADEEDARAAEALAADIRAGADALADQLTTAQERIQEALDLARAAAAEAVALEKVRAEVKATGEKADEAVVRAKAEAKRILGMMTEASRDEVRALADEAAVHIQAATKAAAKVEAAIPLAEQAETLQVAQSILKTSRLALERAEGAADEIRVLVETALERVRRERENAARALDEAREHAAQPVQEATAAARKAESWLDAGQREIADHAPDGPSDRAAEALQALKAGVEQVLKLAEDTAVIAGPAREAETSEEAEAVGARVREAADGTVAHAREARAALDALREVIASERASAEATEAAAAESAENAASARQAADQAAATATELADAVEAAGVSDDAVQEALAATHSGATRARAAAEAAEASVHAASSASTIEDAEAAADAAHDALQQAIEGLAMVVESEAVCRKALAAASDAEEEAARRQHQARRRAETEARKREELRQEAEAEAREEERRKRDEERRARFERRQREREERRGTAAATDRESLRSRLKSRRPPDAGDVASSDTGERPRRRGTTRSRLQRREEAGGDRSVRTWSPDGDGASEADDEARPRRRAAPRRAPRPRPTGKPDEDNAPVDDLLQRLRARKNKDD